MSHQMTLGPITDLPLRDGAPYRHMLPSLPAWIPEGADDDSRHGLIEHFAKQEMFYPKDGDGPFDNPRLPAGYTYFGQFVDHDLTFDPTPIGGRYEDTCMRNIRTPRFDLDSLYGAGPVAQPYLYDQSPRRAGYKGFFAFDRGLSLQDGIGHEPDLPRNAQGFALIGDPRNDENRIVSQLHLAFMHLHNRVLGELLGSSACSLDAFLEARRIVSWFYQYVVINDFLKRILEPSVYLDIVRIQPDDRLDIVTRYAQFGETLWMPLEFSGAAYRFGHSLIRPRYFVNDLVGQSEGDRLPIFSADGSRDLRGERRLPFAGTVQWDWFFDLGKLDHDKLRQKALLIDARLSRSVFCVPDDHGGSNPLAYLNLIRGWKLGLPDGVSVAQRLGVTPLDVPSRGHPLNALWVYVLRESHDMCGGRCLGEVGSRIVGETIAGLMAADPTSYLNQHPTWTPAEEASLPQEEPFAGEQWEVRDILLAAGVPIDRRQVNEQVTGVFGVEDEWLANGA